MPTLPCCPLWLSAAGKGKAPSGLPLDWRRVPPQAAGSRAQQTGPIYSLFRGGTSLLIVVIKLSWLSGVAMLLLSLPLPLLLLHRSPPRQVSRARLEQEPRRACRIDAEAL
jgi:hypothetical protein